MRHSQESGVTSWPGPKPTRSSSTSDCSKVRPAWCREQRHVTYSPRLFWLHWQWYSAVRLSVVGSNRNAGRIKWPRLLEQIFLKRRSFVDLTCVEIHVDARFRVDIYANSLLTATNTFCVDYTRHCRLDERKLGIYPSLVAPFCLMLVGRLPMMKTLRRLLTA